MTDRELPQQMIDRTGKKPQVVKFEDDNSLREVGQDPALVRSQARGNQRRQHPVAVR